MGLDVKEMASKILKVGKSRVRVDTTTEENLKNLMTREDVRALIDKGIIYTVEKKGTCRKRGKEKQEQKKKGRRRGPGSKKGKAGAKTPKKRTWITKVRALRAYLKDLLVSGKLDQKHKNKVYSLIKGGSFKGKKALKAHLEESGMLS